MGRKGLTVSPCLARFSVAFGAVARCLRTVECVYIFPIREPSVPLQASIHLPGTQQWAKEENTPTTCLAHSMNDILIRWLIAYHTYNRPARPPKVAEPARGQLRNLEIHEATNFRRLFFSP